MQACAITIHLGDKIGQIIVNEVTGFSEDDRYDISLWSYKQAMWNSVFDSMVIEFI